MKIIKWPDERLRTVCTPVISIPHPRVVAEMAELCRKKGGVALAAPQVGLPGRFFVVVGPKLSEPMVFVNPFWMPDAVNGSKVDMIEGCLSTPGRFETIKRWDMIKVRYYSKDMKNQIYERLTGYQAQIFQHECEHLDGKFYLDNLETK